MSKDSVEALRQEIAKGHMLVVVGAGISIGATHGNPLASWKGLLEDGIARCVRKRDDKWAGRLREDLAGNLSDLLSVAERVSATLSFPNGPEYRAWLAETVGSLHAQDRSVLEAIRDLGLPLATTNYDGLLEEVTGHPAVTWRAGSRIRRLLQGEEPGIFHLHGYWNEPESVILGIRSYERILGHEHTQAVLRAMQTLKTFLFIGCGEGLDDPNFSALFEWMRLSFRDIGDRHFWLCLDQEEEDLLRNNLIRPVPYGSEHSSLLQFLKYLKSVAEARASQTVVISSASRLPGKPRCFGREAEVQDLVETLLQPSPPPIPILGGPGAGKTTVTLAALHDRRVAERYSTRRFFVRCDGATTREALISEIGRTMGVEPGPNPEASLFQALEAAPAVLVLASTEVPWEWATIEVEDLLTALSSVEGLAMVASIRGDQRPLGPSWRSSIRVGPLGFEAARDVFLAVAGERFRTDPDLDRLLEAVDRLALAIVLLAHEAEGEPSLSNLWKRWREKRTALLKHADGKERLTEIEVSLDLSVSGPRMTSAARRLLSVLALLPVGVVYEDLDAFMPGEGAEAAAVLRKVGLGFDQGSRLRVLAPVQEYVRGKYPPEPQDLDRAVDHYLEIGRKGALIGRTGGAEAAAKLIPELGNLDVMISKGLEREDPSQGIWAAIDLGKLLQMSGWGTQDSLQRALRAAQAGGHQQLEANCTQSLGDIALARSDYDAARVRYEKALPLFRTVGDVLGEANCIQSLGEIALFRSDHETARARCEEALSLYRTVGDVLGEANCILRLGDIAFARVDRDAARARYEEALLLCRSAGYVLGEANCIRSLGNIAFERSDHDAARARYEEALPLYRNVGSVAGEANCTLRLGDIALARADHYVARARYEEALSLYRIIGDVSGEANCLLRFGEVTLALAEHDKARVYYEQALSLFRMINASVAEAHVIKRLADISLSTRGLSTAVPLYEEARHLFSLAGVSTADMPDFGDLLSQQLASANKQDEAVVQLQTLKAIETQLKRGHIPQNIVLFIEDLDRFAENSTDAVRNLAADMASYMRRWRIGKWIGWLNGDLAPDSFESLPDAEPGFPSIVVRGFRLRNIRGFVDTNFVSINDARSENPQPLLLLGDNASGKSTILKCIALAALGPELALLADNRPESYIRNGASRGFIEVAFYLRLDGSPDPSSLGEFWVGIEVKRDVTSFEIMSLSDTHAGSNSAARIKFLRSRNERFGLICGYGPFRGFTDDKSSSGVERPSDVLDRVYSLFRQRGAFMDPDLLTRLLEGDLTGVLGDKQSIHDAAAIQESLVSQIVSVLPELEGIDPKEPSRLLLQGVSVALRDLSDGYASLLALVGHLFRHAIALNNCRDPRSLFGIVMIDEIDLHLHPSWQRSIISDLKKVFPGVQFILSSHSPIVAGSVDYQSLLVLQRDGRIMRSEESFEGLRSDQIATSPLFSLPTTRSLRLEALFSEYSDLLLLHGPDNDEVRELAKEVSEMMRLRGENVLEEKAFALLDKLARQVFEELSEGDRARITAYASLFLADN